MGEARLSARFRAPLTLAALVLGAVLAAAPAPLLAHASLVKSAPAQRSTLYRAPGSIQLWFNERLEPKYSSLSLVDAAGNAVETGMVQVGPDDPRRLSAAVKDLAPGRYTVKYRVLSTDGHIVESQFSFTVRK